MVEKMILYVVITRNNLFGARGESFFDYLDK